MESLTVNTFVHDIQKTIAFYKILGFEVIMTVPEEGDMVWAMVKNEGVTLMFQALSSLGEDLPEMDRTKTGGTLLLYIKLKQIRSFFERIKDQVALVKGLEKTFYGATEFTIKDVDGYYLTFAEEE